MRQDDQSLCVSVLCLYTVHVCMCAFMCASGQHQGFQATLESVSDSLTLMGRVFFFFFGWRVKSVSVFIRVGVRENVFMDDITDREHIKQR